jgi:adenosylcobinamide-GDP ribazoletransferase
MIAGAIQFLTVIPIRGRTASPGESAIFFPIIGALLGATAGLFVHGPLGALLAIAYLCAITGCLHEDGLADVADAVRAGRSREKILAILKDSRIGTYGAAALIVSILLRWQALAQCRINPIYGLAAALALSRTSMVALAAITPPVGEGLANAFFASLRLGERRFFFVLAQALALPFLAGWPHAIVMILASAAVILLARAWFLKRIGGVNGDCLGATCQAVETVNLLLLTWQPSF